MGWNASQDYVGGPLSDNIANRPRNNDVVVLIAIEIEFFLPETKAFVILEVSIHLISIPRVPKVKRVESSFKRNFLSSFDASAESHSHPFQLRDGVDDAIDTAFLAIVCQRDVVMLQGWKKYTEAD